MVSETLSKPSIASSPSSLTRRKEMAGAIAQTLQDLLIDAAPQPDLIIPHLHALEMRRAQVLEMARALHAMEGRTEEEKRMYAIMESTLGHEEQARRFVAIDILWRCLVSSLLSSQSCS